MATIHPSMRIGQIAVQELSADGLGVAMMNGLEVDGVNGERVRYGQGLIGGVVFPELTAAAIRFVMV